MIYLNYFLQLVFILFLLSVESTLATPIFSLFLAFKFLDRFNPRDDHSFYWLLVLLLLISLAVALFYQLGVGVSVAMIAVYYYLRTLLGRKVFLKSSRQWQLLQLLLFAVLQVTIFFLSDLTVNYFMILQGVVILMFLIYKTISINKL
jgi:hypothetical protein